MKKRIAILGSTGSIGKTSLNIFKNNPKKFEIELKYRDPFFTSSGLRKVKYPKEKTKS